MPRKQNLRQVGARSLALGVWVVLAVACEPHPADRPDSGAAAPLDAEPRDGSGEGSGRAEAVGVERGDTVPADETVIISMGTERVTLGDIERAIHQRALLGPLPPDQLAPPDWRRDPYFLWSVADEVLQRRRLLREGERLHLLPDLDQLLAAWREHPDLSVYLTDRLDDAEARLQSAIGLGVDDVYDLLRVEIVRERWLDLVFERVTEAQLREEYEWRNRTVTVEVVSIANVPSQRELRDFVAHPPQPDFFEAEVAAHPGRYTRPPSADVRYVRVRLGEDAPPEEETEARARIDALREEVLSGADMAALETELSSEPSAESAGLLERVVERQLPSAFQQAVGEVGPVERDRFGFVFYRVERRYPAERRPLDELLRREIASNFLARDHPMAEPMAEAERVLEAMRSGDEETIDRLVLEHAVSRQVVGPIRREADGLIPGVGRSEELSEALFSLTRPGETVARPFLVEANVVDARLVERHDPTAAEFEEDREAFEAEFRELIRATAWDAFWAQALEAEPMVWEVGDEYFGEGGD